MQNMSSVDKNCVDILQRNPKYKAVIVVKKYLHTEGSELQEEITPNYNSCAENTVLPHLGTRWS
jgi:hypothetical protein